MLQSESHVCIALLSINQVVFSFTSVHKYIESATKNHVYAYNGKAGNFLVRSHRFVSLCIFAFVLPAQMLNAPPNWNANEKKSIFHSSSLFLHTFCIYLLMCAVRSRSLLSVSVHRQRSAKASSAVIVPSSFWIYSADAERVAPKIHCHLISNN